MTERLKRTGIASAMALAIAVSAPAAFAQAQPASPQQAPQQTAPQQAPQDNAAAPQSAAPAPSDAELKQFAGAMVDVEGIRASLQPQLEAAKTEDARTQLKQSAEKKMEAAVQSHQLSLQRYVEIANLVQTDSSVRAKVQQLLPPQQPSKS